MRRSLVFTAALGLLLTAAAPVVAKSPHSAYDPTVLVSDTGVDGSVVDPNLVNGWGLSRTAGSPWWVADNGMNVSTLYNGAGMRFPLPPATPLVVSVPNKPTGTVADLSPVGFQVVNAAGATVRAPFLFDTEEGKILGWPGSGAAVLGLDRSGVGAIYKGLAIALANGTPTLYAADFHNARVDVVTPDPTTPTTWNVTTAAGGFVDPGLPAGYAPFGIQNINDTIFVTYAKQDADAEDEIAGDGFGFVDAYGLDGTLLGRVASGDSLNAPWGLAQAPADGFGEFGGQLLVGNFGDGRINAFRWGSWEPDGHLKLDNHRPLVIDGLWAIAFGGGNANSGPATSLYFAAGPDDESHGAFGTITLD
jgi:uncharacterized protein (TIGR03118 family)